MQSLQIQPLTDRDVSGSFISRFRAVAAALPDVPALVDPNTTLTFAQADAGSDLLAAALLAELPPGVDPVATLFDHGVSGMLGLLGVLKCGRPVVPLDSLVPEARLEQIASTAGAVACLTSARHHATAEALGPTIRVVVDLERVLANPTSATARRDLPSMQSSDVAALVFTSGSTGTPKGVVWTHGTLVNEAYAGAERFGFSQADRMALVLPYSFAAGLTVLVFALLNGASVYAFDPRTRGIRDLPDWLASQRLTTLHATPSLLRSFVGALTPGQMLSDLRLLLACGEPVYGADIANLRPHLPAECVCVNWAGASEIGTLAFCSIGPHDPLPDGPVPAGRAAAGKEITLYREDGSPAVAGETGEVVVTSAYCAAGYWSAPAATASRFSPSPDGRTTYRTGDLGRFDSAGILTLLGRRDAAVKVGGYLVEPSEIEAALLAAPGVSEVVVVAISRPPAATRLIAYFAPKAGVTVPSAAALRRLLRAKLPSWMVPATIVALPALPRNERGKVDRLALPPPPERSTAYVEPALTFEIVVADLWMKVLGLDEISLDDDFLELGGDSINAQELLAVIAQEVGVTLPSNTLVEAPTLRAFAARVEHGDRKPQHPTLALLRTTGNRPPIFCIAGAAQLGLAYLSLAHELGEDQPIYGFHAQGLEQRAIPDWSIEANARRHLKMLRLLAPRGPYIVAGHSLGGLIAMELAHQLREAGERVALLALLDTYLPEPALQTLGLTRPGPDVPVRPLIQEAGADDRAAAASGNKLSRLARDVVSELRHRASGRRLRLPNVKKALRTLCAGVIRFEGMHQFEAFYYQALVMERLYHPRPWSGRTLVFRGLDNPEPEHVWDNWITGSRKTIHLACNHVSVLREPHVATIATHMRTEIDAIVATATPAPDVVDRASVARSF